MTNPCDAHRPRNCGNCWRTRKSPATRLARSKPRKCAAARWSALLDTGVIALGVAGVDLPRTADSRLRIHLLLQPVGDPSRGPRDGEHDGEHFRRNAQCLVDDARVEIDVRVELALDEVV